MNGYYYSADNNEFFPVELESQYREAGTFPDDAVIVPDEISNEFIQAAPPGKMRAAGEERMPQWVDIPVPTQAEIEEAAEAKKNQLRVLADAEIVWRQDAVNEGIATEEEVAALAEWKKYRVLLMRINTADPDWPTPPGQQTS